MLANVSVVDPWAQTIWLLQAPVRPLTASEGGGRPHEAAHCADGCFAGVVTLIERPTPSTATIAWRDATRGCFGDQVWRTARARIPGFCVMSGRAIKPGDAVYKPNPRPTPVNADAMILACVLRDAATL